MLNDLNFYEEALAQFATGSITYGNPVEAEFATGSITYGTPVAAEFASFTLEIVDYTQLVGQTITVDGTVLTEGVEFTAATDNNTTGASIAAAIHALANWTATGTGVVTAKWVARGTIGNGKTIATSAAGGITVNGGAFPGTSAGGVNGDTVAVGGTTFTCVASAPGANEFTNITELEALVEAVSNISSSQNGTVVSISYTSRGTAGNAVTLVLGGANAGTMAVSGATLSGGVNGDTVAVDGNTFTAVASAPGANEFSNITELEALVEAVTNIVSSQNGTVVTIQYALAGTAGNAVTLALGGSNAGTMTISGVTLTGGSDGEDSDVLQMDEEAVAVRTFVKVEDISSGAIVTVTPYVSPDSENWRALPAIVLSANGTESEEITDIDTFLKFTTVVDGGTTPSATVTIKAQPVASTSPTETDHDFYDSDAAEASAIVKDGSGKFYSIAGRIVGVAATDDYYIFAYDDDAVPADGAIDTAKRLMLPIHVDHTTGDDTLFSFSFAGRSFSDGLTIFVSTTDDLTKTLAGTVAKFTVEFE